MGATGRLQHTVNDSLSCIIDVIVDVSLQVLLLAWTAQPVNCIFCLSFIHMLIHTFIRAVMQHAFVQMRTFLSGSIYEVLSCQAAYQPYHFSDVV